MMMKDQAAYDKGGNLEHHESGFHAVHSIGELITVVRNLVLAVA